LRAAQGEGGTSGVHTKLHFADFLVHILRTRVRTHANFHHRTRVQARTCMKSMTKSTTLLLYLQQQSYVCTKAVFMLGVGAFTWPPCGSW